MAKCARCKKRKAKRFCLALGESICSLCCGILREKEIHCPSNCTFLIKHKPYQEKRIIGKKQKISSAETLSENDVTKDERLVWLAFYIEMPIKAFAEKNASFMDKDALLALEYAKEKIEKGKGILIVPDEKTGPRNELGEAIYQSVEKCRYEKKIVLPGEKESYSSEEKIKCLERISFSVKYWAKGNYEDRNYTDRLLERFSRLQRSSPTKKFILAS
jgi:hypothetical protein